MTQQKNSKPVKKVSISLKKLLIGCLIGALAFTGLGAGGTYYLIKKCTSNEPVAVTVKKNDNKETNKETKSDSSKTNTEFKNNEKTDANVSNDTPSSEDNTSDTGSENNNLGYKWLTDLNDLNDPEIMDQVKAQATDWIVTSLSSYFEAKNPHFEGYALLSVKDGVDQNKIKYRNKLIVIVSVQNYSETKYDAIFYDNVKIDKNGKIVNPNVMGYQEYNISYCTSLDELKSKINSNVEYYKVSYSPEIA